MKPICVIAEIGVNHNGDCALAREMVWIAKIAGADYAKFQTEIPGMVVSQFAQKAKYQIAQTGGGESQLEMLERLMPSYENFIELQKECERAGIGFISTPFDIKSISFLASLDVPFFKVPSGEITHLPYLIEIGRQKKPVIMSTGMAELPEIGAATRVLRENGAEDITLLHCNTQYPTPFADANLRAMETLHREFGLPVGYSDHTQGIEAAIAAAAMGACVIEKHFTLDRNMDGPDHKASIEPDELAAMVRAIRNVELALGDGFKRVTDSERENMNIARKSIVAARDIRAGEVFAEENITAKRPGNGISPMRWFEVLGTAAKRDFAYDELIEV